jgi:PTH1 family peptidyl-tRNA hydrolase
LKLVIGLGNPGQQYSGTRHNVGFDVVRELSARWECGKPQLKFNAEICDATVGTCRVLLVCPMTYMNKSGESVQPLMRFYQIAADDLVVVCDDMNLPHGKIRWRAEGSAGGQKGLENILLRLGSDKISRLRLGVGRPPGQTDPSAWVLSHFRTEEREGCQHMIAVAADSVALWIDSGITAVMNQYNRAT